MGICLDNLIYEFHGLILTMNNWATVWIVGQLRRWVREIILTTSGNECMLTLRKYDLLSPLGFLVSIRAVIFQLLAPWPRQLITVTSDASSTLINRGLNVYHRCLRMRSMMHTCDDFLLKFYVTFMNSRITLYLPVGWRHGDDTWSKWGCFRELGFSGPGCPKGGTVRYCQYINIFEYPFPAFVVQRFDQWMKGLKDRDKASM